MEPSDIKDTNDENHPIKSVLWNANGLRNKTHYLEYLISTHTPTIVAITETKLDSTVGDSELCTGYTIYRRDRRSSGGLGGGVLIAVSDKSPVIVSNVFINSECEMIALNLNINGYTMVAGCYYRPPSERSLYSFYKWIEAETTPNILIMGDFNLPTIRWNTDRPTIHTDAVTHPFVSFLHNNNLTQHVRSSTHVKGNILDLVISSIPVNDVDCEPSISDHHVITYVIDIPVDPRPTPNIPPPKYHFIFSKSNNKQLSDDLKMLELQLTKMTANASEVDALWEAFRSGIIEAANRNIPKVKCKPKQARPWITKNTIRQMRKRQRLYKVTQKYPSSQNTVNLREQSKMCKKLVRDDYNNHLNKHICNELDSGNTKPLFKFIADKRGQKNTIKNLDGCDNENPNDVPNSFAKAFASVYSPPDRSVLQPAIQSPVGTYDPEIRINRDGILKLLQSLDPRKGAGPDELGPALLKHLAAHIATMVTLIMQVSLDTGKVPKAWKRATVVPIYKNKGRRSDPLNYRPISLTCILSKLAEHVIASNIRRHLDNNHLLSDCQHGFRKGRSCDSQLLTTTTDFVNSFDQKTQTDVIILDFAKAFDVVPFAKLISKMESLAINKSTVGWVKEWLTDRSSVVIVNNNISLPHAVTSGVPQGSVLGPLLFLIYINDMPPQVTSTLRLFADDSLLYRTITSNKDIAMLQNDLDSLASWASKWQMRFNVSKCEHASIISGPHITSAYTLGGKQVKQVPTFKYLGVTIDESLSFNPQVELTCKKSTNSLHMLMRSLKNANIRTKTLAYSTICRPTLEYACTTWSPRLARQVAALEAVNRKAFRWAYRMKKSDPISDLMTRSGWPSLQERRVEADMKMLRKIMANEIAVDLGDHRLNTRHTRMGYLREHCSTDVKKFAFFNRAIGLTMQGE